LARRSGGRGGNGARIVCVALLTGAIAGFGVLGLVINAQARKRTRADKCVQAAAELNRGVSRIDVFGRKLIALYKTDRELQDQLVWLTALLSQATRSTDGDTSDAVKTLNQQIEQTQAKLDQNTPKMNSAEDTYIYWTSAESELIAKIRGRGAAPGGPQSCPPKTRKRVFDAITNAIKLMGELADEMAKAQASGP
jgi:hypothetical protein